MRIAFRFVCLFAALSLGAASASCSVYKTHSYLKFRKVGRAEIHRPAHSIPVLLLCEVRAAGARLEGVPGRGASESLRDHVERALLATGVFDPNEGSASSAKLRVTASHNFDLQAAAALKGGPDFDESYDLTFEYTPAEGRSTAEAGSMKRTYQSSLHATIDASPAASSEDNWWRGLVEDATLAFVKDVQDAETYTR